MIRCFLMIISGEDINLNKKFSIRDLFLVTKGIFTVDYYRRISNILKPNSD